MMAMINNMNLGSCDGSEVGRSVSQVLCRQLTAMVIMSMIMIITVMATMVIMKTMLVTLDHVTAVKLAEV